MQSEGGIAHAVAATGAWIKRGAQLSSAERSGAPAPRESSCELGPTVFRWMEEFDAPRTVEWTSPT